MSTTTNVASTASSSAGTTSQSVSTTNAEASDRFLKLLVTQMQNQDPLNPLDNAQVTSQMAQINTVTGIDKLNSTMSGVADAMNSSLTQMQMLQGASLVGHQVRVDGNALAVDSNGLGRGAYDLSAAAGTVRVEVLNAGGSVLGTVDKQGAAAGMHNFEWQAPAGTPTNGLSFRVTASTGGKAVSSTPLMLDDVNAVSTSNGALNLELRHSGNVSYSKVRSVS